MGGAHEGKLPSIEVLAKPVRIKDLVRDMDLKEGHWVQANEAKSGRLAGEWGQIQDPTPQNGKIQVHWKGKGGLNPTKCEIMAYCRRDPQKSVDGVHRLKVPMRLTKLITEKKLNVGARVQAGPDQGKSPWTGFARKGGEWGRLQDTKGMVHWDEGMKGSTNCSIIAYEHSRRRRLGSHRDSAVMQRLLEAIRAA